MVATPPGRRPGPPGPTAVHERLLGLPHTPMHTHKDTGTHTQAAPEHSSGWGFILMGLALSTAWEQRGGPVAPRSGWEVGECPSQEGWHGA